MSADEIPTSIEEYDDEDDEEYFQRKTAGYVRAMLASVVHEVVFNEVFHYPMIEEMVRDELRLKKLRDMIAKHPGNTDLDKSIDKVTKRVMNYREALGLTFQRIKRYTPKVTTTATSNRAKGPVMVTTQGMKDPDMDV